MLHRTGLRHLAGLALQVAGLMAVATEAIAQTAPPPPVKPLAVRLADGVLSRWPAAASISNKGFEYNTGIVLWGIAEVYRHTRDPRYLGYIRTWVDSYLREDGSVDLGDDAAGHNLDRIQPGNLVLFLFEETGDPKYAKTARWLRARFDTFPRNSQGGFWHKQKYPDEMWLDGIYMAEPFLVRYGRLFSEPGFCFDTAVAQTLLVAEKTGIGGGLFRHAWDADRNAAWADPTSGASPTVWGRAMGWYLMALVDILAELPPEHPGYPRLRALLREAANGVSRTQDPKTGLWYQVLDRGERPDNWLETSASAMFVYALKRGADTGLLDSASAETARKGWSGLQGRISTDQEGRPVVEGSVEGMSVQKDLEGYLGRKRLADSAHGLCGMLLAASAIEWSAAGSGAPRVEATVKEPVRAFPGAEGFGAFAVGGRGGDVYHVTTLSDAGPGSLRSGVETAKGPRTIVFDLSGTIFLRSALTIDKPFLTLAGQTAPGEGVTVAGFETSISGTHDVIVRYMRFRPGDINCPAFQGDALSVSRSHDVIIDHVSASWSIDEALSVTHSDRVTVGWSIIAESLNASCHAKGHHGYGSLLRWGQGGLTFHHNLYAHHASRNPRLGDDVGLDFVNNVIYDWGREAGYSGPAAEGSPRLNYVANLLVAGPSTDDRKRGLAFTCGSDQTQLFQRGNRVDGTARGPLASVPGELGLFSNGCRPCAQRFPFPAVATDDAVTAYHHVLADAGASLARDGVDLSILRSVAAKTGVLVNSQKEVGGWPELQTAPPPADSDRDGMSDAWEAAHDLDGRNPSDGATIGPAGISNLELYLNERACTSATPATAAASSAVVRPVSL
ncbi:MAG TPA: glycoside hydrolase family 88 protein [Thermoanaerobaculaceae bacterium]|nr:glycoside hydrolase family 88 protein [Thermoanaerobaculaceae bacterium]HPS76620.1 glycoside hydrolase family 88 protein [Thermoanaerobaculaceae bacterium]